MFIKIIVDLNKLILKSFNTMVLNLKAHTVIIATIQLWRSKTINLNVLSYRQHSVCWASPQSLKNNFFSKFVQTKFLFISPFSQKNWNLVSKTEIWSVKLKFGQKNWNLVKKTEIWSEIKTTNHCFWLPHMCEKKDLQRQKDGSGEEKWHYVKIKLNKKY